MSSKPHKNNEASIKNRKTHELWLFDVIYKEHE